MVNLLWLKYKKETNVFLCFLEKDCSNKTRLFVFVNNLTEILKIRKRGFK